MSNSSPHEGSSDSDCNLVLQASDRMSEGESERTTPKSIKPPKNPIAKRRDYTGPPPKPKENPRGAAKRKRGQSQHNTPIPGTSTEPVAGIMTREYNKK